MMEETAEGAVMEEPQFVTLVQPVDPVHRSLIESTLKQAGIFYRTRNVPVQDLFGLGQIGGYNVVTGGIEIQVESTFLEEARRALADLDAEASTESTPAELSGEPDDSEKETESESEQAARRYANGSLIWSLVWLGGLGSLVAIFFGLRAVWVGGRKPSVVLVKALLGTVMGLLGLVFFLWIMGLHIPGT